VTSVGLGFFPWINNLNYRRPIGRKGWPKKRPG